MRQIFLFISISVLFMRCGVCFSQEQTITSYQNKDNQHLNIRLNGKVKFVKEFFYDPRNYCDTLLDYIYNYVEQLGTRLEWQVEAYCRKDTIVYFFDINLLPDSISFVAPYIEIDDIGGCDLKWALHTETYKFKNGKLISENSVYPHSDGLTKYTYDSNDNIIRKIQYFKPNKKPYQIETYQYDTRGNLIEEASMIIEYKYTKTYMYTYDSNGNKIEEGYFVKYKRKKGEYEPWGRLVYDENNRLIKEISIDNRIPYNERLYKYDEAGNKIDVKDYNIKKNAVLTYHIAYEYDKVGNKIDEKQYYFGNDTVLFYHNVYEYNENGQQTKEQTNYYLSDGTIKYKTLITKYDTNKNIALKEYYRDDNQAIWFVRCIYTYDAFGNWIKQERYEGKDEENLSIRLIKEREIEYYEKNF